MEGATKGMGTLGIDSLLLLWTTIHKCVYPHPEPQNAMHQLLKKALHAPLLKRGTVQPDVQPIPVGSLT